MEQEHHIVIIIIISRVFGVIVVEYVLRCTSDGGEDRVGLVIHERLVRKGSELHAETVFDCAQVCVRSDFDYEFITFLVERYEMGEGCVGECSDSVIILHLEAVSLTKSNR